jgi:hypothetical protein
LARAFNQPRGPDAILEITPDMRPPARLGCRAVKGGFLIAGSVNDLSDGAVAGVSKRRM